MQNMQDIWIRLQDTKKQQREITLMYKDTLENSPEHKELTDQIKGLSLRKKQIEAEARAEMGSQYEKLNALKKDAQLDKELLSDVALNTLMKGETVKIVDTENNEYEPIFSVRFRKQNEVNQKQE